MRRRLQNKKDATPQAVTLHNMSTNIKKVFERESKESITNFLKQLQKIESVLEETEMEKLQQKLEQVNVEEFVSDLITCLSEKPLGDTEKIISVFKETEIMSALGSQCEEVLDYCKKIHSSISCSFLFLFFFCDAI